MNLIKLYSLILTIALASLLPSALLAQEQANAETIHDLAAKGDLSKLKNVLSVKSNLLNAPRESDNATPLHLAVSGGHFEMVKYLIDIGADANAKIDNGKTPLHLAASYVGMLFPGKKIAEALIAAGAKIDSKAEGDGNQQPLHYAALYNSADVAELLMEKGADVNATAETGARPLHLASLGVNQSTGGQWTGDLLIAKKADVNDRAWENQVTALWIASGRQDQNDKIVEKLLKAGADPKMMADGKTPFQLARDKGHTAIIAVFIKYGVKE